MRAACTGGEETRTARLNPTTPIPESGSQLRPGDAAAHNVIWRRAEVRLEEVRLAEARPAEVRMVEVRPVVVRHADVVHPAPQTCCSSAC
jgi:hypothetical protein